MGQFLGWFVIRKVIAGQGFLKACGTVTKKLGEWWMRRATSMRPTWPSAGRMRAMSCRRRTSSPSCCTSGTRSIPAFDTDSIPDHEWIEDQLWIERVEPGALWLDGGIGPVKVPKKASDLARPGWAVTLTLAKVVGEWRILEVGNVYP